MRLSLPELIQQHQALLEQIALCYTSVPTQHNPFQAKRHHLQVFGHH